MNSFPLKVSRLVLYASVFIVVFGVGAFFVVSGIHKPVIIADSQTPLGGFFLMLDEGMKEYPGSGFEGDGAVCTKVHGFNAISLPADTTDVRMLLLNPDGNQCYFSFELVVEGETYYTSKLVAPAMCIEDLTLSKPLAKGVYSATLVISTYSLDDSLALVNGANVEFGLTVV